MMKISRIEIEREITRLRGGTKEERHTAVMMAWMLDAITISLFDRLMK